MLTLYKSLLFTNIHHLFTIYSLLTTCLIIIHHHSLFKISLNHTLVWTTTILNSHYNFTIFHQTSSLQQHLDPPSGASLLEAETPRDPRGRCGAAERPPHHVLRHLGLRQEALLGPSIEVLQCGLKQQNGGFQHTPSHNYELLFNHHFPIFSHHFPT